VGCVQSSSDSSRERRIAQCAASASGPESPAPVIACWCETEQRRSPRARRRRGAASLFGVRPGSGGFASRPVRRFCDGRFPQGRGVRSDGPGDEGRLAGLCWGSPGAAADAFPSRSTSGRGWSREAGSWAAPDPGSPVRPPRKRSGVGGSGEAPRGGCGFAGGDGVRRTRGAAARGAQGCGAALAGAGPGCYLVWLGGKCWVFTERGFWKEFFYLASLGCCQ